MLAAIWDTRRAILEIYSAILEISSKLVEISSELVEISSELVEISSKPVEISSEPVLTSLELLITNTFRITTTLVSRPRVSHWKTRRQPLWFFTFIRVFVKTETSFTNAELIASTTDCATSQREWLFFYRKCLLWRTHKQSTDRKTAFQKPWNLMPTTRNKPLTRILHFFRPISFFHKALIFNRFMQCVMVY